MKYYDWDKDKNEKLKVERDVGFEEVLNAFDSGGLIKITKNPNSKKYPYQKVYIVNIDNYIYIVPFVEDDDKYFLKTIFPSRKMTKQYLSKK